MVSDMEGHMKRRYGIEFLHAKKITPIDIKQHLLKAYEDQTVDVSTVRQRVVLSAVVTVGHLHWCRFS